MPADVDFRIRDEFTLLYGCPKDFFNLPGTHLRTVDSLAGKNTVYLTRYDDWSFLAVSPEDAERLGERLDTSQVFNPADFGNFWTSERLEDRLHGRILPFDVESRAELCEGYSLKEHNPAYHPLLEEFLAKCSPQELDDADIDLEDPDDAIVLVMRDDVPVAYSGYRILRKNLGDMGILVSPEYRRLGLATAGLSRCIEICRERNYIPLYRHWESNTNSDATASRLGFRRTYTVEVYDLES